MSATSGMKWIPNEGKQTEAYFSKADIMLYGGSGGGGKGFRPDQKVLTPFGWREIAKLKVGSAICGTDGTVQRVIGYYPRGVQPLFKLSWSDGSSTVCDADHIWLGWIANRSRKISLTKTSGQGGARKWTTKEIYSHYQKRNYDKIGIPVISSPCAFNVHGENHGKDKHVSRSVPPYVLGVILGDGCLTGNNVSFCSTDDEIPARVQSLTAQKISKYPRNDGCHGYRFHNSAYLDALKDFGLMGCDSENKFIPRIYLFGGVEERWELLRGLMDTDGWCEDDGDCYYTSVSKQLAEDVRHLARSLGAIVTWREKMPKYTHLGKSKTGKRAYTLRIKMLDAHRMFSLERKADRCKDKKPQTMAIWLDNIEPCGSGETICIAVSNPNSLFITEDFIVTHNSSLVLGLALTQHKRSLILRRQYGDLSALTDEAVKFNGTREGFAASPHPNLKTKDGRLIEFRAVQYEDDVQKLQGNPHDLLAFDEAVHFTESQVRFLMGWNRTTEKGLRCRVVMTSNPPVGSQGTWIIKFFAPWLDPTHPNPAKSGELRWFITNQHGEDVEVDGSAPVEIDGVTYKPMSRTYISASLKDNPFLYGTNYQAVLDSLPEPMRSAIRDGNFMAAKVDEPDQLIPTDWVRAAIARWTPKPPVGIPMCAIGCDPAGGGKDKTIIAVRHDGWYAPLVSMSGEETPHGQNIGGKIMSLRRDNCPVVMDMGGGYGNLPMQELKNNGIKVYAHTGAGEAKSRTADKLFAFNNARSEIYCKFAEALNPNQIGGSSIALPDDPELISQLTAITVKINTQNKKQVLPKELVKEKLGVSPDKADAVVMAWAAGSKMDSDGSTWIEKRASMGKLPTTYITARNRRK